MSEAKTPAGMAPAEEWAKTEVHKASAYFCLRCGEEFLEPQEFYIHEESCEGIPEITAGSRVRLTKAVGIVERINGDTAQVKWDTGAKCPLPVYWLTREEPPND